MNDEDMINEPDNWPRWPVLPVKRGWECGLMFAIKEHRHTVFEGNMFNLPGATIGEIIDQLPTRHTYPDTKALLADGWRVD